jgi:hypothetical protein
LSPLQLGVAVAVPLTEFKAQELLFRGRHASWLDNIAECFALIHGE